jgi:hypothetical protein
MLECPGENAHHGCKNQILRQDKRERLWNQKTFELPCGDYEQEYGLF